MKISIRMKLLGGFLIVSLLAGLVGYIGVTSIKKIGESDITIYNQITVPIETAGALNTTVNRMRVRVFNLITAEKESDKAEHVTKIKDYLIKIEKLNADLKKILTSGELKEKIDKFGENYVDYNKFCNSVMEIPAKDHTAAVALVLKEEKISSHKAIAELDALTELLNKEGKKVMGESDKIEGEAISEMQLLVISNVVISLIFGWLLASMINGIIRGLNGECEKLINAVNEGKLDIRGDEEKTNFEFRGIVKGINDIMNAFIKPLNLTAEYVDRISKGDIPPKITDEYKGDFNEIKNNLNQCIDAINSMINDSNALAMAASEGKLSHRADSSKHQGDFKGIIEGFNITLDSIIMPLKTAAVYIEKISKGDMPEKITYQYQGDFNDIKNNLNACIVAISTLVEEMGVVITAGRDGDLGKRAGADRLNGVYRKILSGVNDTLDAVIKPVQEAVKCLAQLAEGNLAVEMSGEYKGEHAILKNSLNTTINSMNEILGQVSIAVDQVNTGSRQVSDASQALSQGATETASSLEEISSSMQEINSQIEKTAANSMEADNLAGSVRTSAESGSGKMTQMTSAMNEINEAATSISKIIKAIDEIAFQTNLLALNAAVEAARAGKHGKGFTVVAEEVRNLAQRSAKAAKETAEMIESSIKKTEAGTKIADETARSLMEIVTGVGRVGDIIGEIAAASKEEALGIQQINQGLGQVDQVTQQNTATAEEAAAASEELSAQAVELMGMLEKFKLRGRTAKNTVNAYLKGPQEVKNQRTTITVKSIQPPAPVKKNENKAGNAKKTPGAAGNSSGRVNPEDIISLDDREFGKF